MRRLFVPPDRIADGRAELGAADVHYLRDVLRLGPGAPVEVFDGEGGAYDGRLEPGGAAVRLGARRAGTAPAARLGLAFALARGERCDLVVQKATELGVARLVPFQAERSVVRLDPERAAERTRRWRRIAEEAARQCGRRDVPSVEAPTGLQAAVAAIPGARVVLLYERGGEPLVDVVVRGGEHLLVVGPEGGFTDVEVGAAVAAGARLATLGPRVLRFETAAVVGVALVQHLAGDLGGPSGPER